MHENIREGGIRETSFDLKVQTSSNPRVWNPSYVEILESGRGVAFRMFQPVPWGLENKLLGLRLGETFEMWDVTRKVF